MAADKPDFLTRWAVRRLDKDIQRKDPTGEKRAVYQETLALGRKVIDAIAESPVQGAWTLFHPEDEVIEVRSLDGVFEERRIR
jgi:hypothetical protein